MSGKLIPKHMFGINPKSANCMAIIADDQHIAYVCGRQVVVMSTETNEQSFIDVASQHLHNNNTIGITAIAVNQPKKYIAVAEKNESNTATVILYDSHTLRKKKTFNFGDLASKFIVSIAFSDDGRLCITQGCGPEWNLILWNVEKNPKILASVKMSTSDDNPIHYVSFCPTDCNTIVVVGKAILKLLRYVEGQLRVNNLNVRREHANFISLCWLQDDFLLVGSEGGEIFLLNNFEYRAVLHSSGSTLPEDIAPIYSFISTSRGFIAGTVDELLIFERREDVKEHYQLDKSLQLPKRGRVSNMVINSEECLYISTDTRQIYSLSLSSVFRNDVNTKPEFEYLFSEFHKPHPVTGEASINAIDVALWRPIAATCAKDFTVRTWNINDKKQELMKEYDAEPVTLSLHPSGLYVAVGFLEKIIIESIHNEELSQFKEIEVRNCSFIKFSNGGHLLAASNGSAVQIFDLYTGNTMCTLRGHTNRIRSLTWLNNDSKMISVGAEGCVYNWDLFPVQRKPLNYTGMIPFQAGAALSDGSKAYAATAERTIKEISFKGVVDPNSNIEGPPKECHDVDVTNQISQLLYEDSRKLLLVGTNDENMPGSILAYTTVPQLSSNCDVTPIHSSSITAMCLSHDHSILLTGDANGSLCLSEFDGIGTKGYKAREGIVSFDFVDEVVIHKDNLNKKKKSIQDLLLKVDELTLNNEHQLRLKEMDFKSRSNDIATKYTSQLNAEKEKYEALTKEKDELENSFMNEIDALVHKNDSDMKAAESKYVSKVNAETNRHKNLIEETEETHKLWNDENNALVMAHQNYLQELSEEYDERIRHEQVIQRQLLTEKESIKKDRDDMFNMIDSDADIEIDDMKIKYQMRLKSEEAIGLELMSQHALMKKNLQVISKDVDHQKEEIKKLKDKELRLLDNVNGLEKEIQLLKREIRDREDTISDKEKRIFDLRKKNQELEKFRFVLDYKIKELKLQIAPREAEITVMRKQIEEMDLELEQYHKSNASLKLMIGELKLKLDGLRREYTVQGDRLEANIRFMDKYKRDLKDLWDVREELAPLKNQLIHMFRIYVQAEQKDNDSSSSSSGSGKGYNSDDPQLQYNRDREQMERSLDALRRALKSDSNTLKRDKAKMMRESVYLINELNTLRKDYRSLSHQKQAVEKSGGITKANLPFLIDILGIPRKKQSDTSKPARAGVTTPSSHTVTGVDDSDVRKPPGEPSSSATSKTRHRSTAIRTVSANGRDAKSSAGSRSMDKSTSKNDQWEVWREVQMQQETVAKLEDELSSMCSMLNLPFSKLLSQAYDYL